MPTIVMTFPGGRYHATPWGHHVNEGLIEWPPCPWRLLRALLATGYAKLGWSDVPPAGRRLFESLAGVLPTYQLPQASAAHSRHYMPIGELAKGVEKTTLVFDTWANVGDGELLVRWDCQLDDEAARLFAQLVDLLGYLGRSESWVEARVVPDDLVIDQTQVSVPHGNGEHHAADWEKIPLLAALSAQDYALWRESRTSEVRATIEKDLRALWESSGKGPKTSPAQQKKISEAQNKAVEAYPANLVECLQKDTAWWRKQHRWSQPPGARRVLYLRAPDAITVSGTKRSRRPQAHPIEAMLLALATPSRNRSALPHVHRTLPQAELLHRSLVSWLNKQGIEDCVELTGRDVDRRPLRASHQHAHLLPLDLDGDQRLDHLLVWAPMQLRDAAQRAIRSVNRTYMKGGVGELQVSLVGSGDAADMRRLPAPLDRHVRSLLGAPGGSTRWVSSTPFVPPRFLKQRGRNSLEGQVHAELASRGLPPASVEVLAKKTVDLRHYMRIRGRGRKPPPVDCGFGLRIVLESPHGGPLSLGYASHFGLGLFTAEDSHDG